MRCFAMKVKFMSRREEHCGFCRLAALRFYPSHLNAPVQELALGVEQLFRLLLGFFGDMTSNYL